ncbi:MAG: hypothetical protein AAFO07_32950, partial [Bacteroidota bacterium]
GLLLLSTNLLFSQTKQEYHEMMAKMNGGWILVKEKFKVISGVEFPAPDMKMSNKIDGEKYISMTWGKMGTENWEVFSQDTSVYDEQQKRLTVKAGLPNPQEFYVNVSLQADGNVLLKEFNLKNEKLAEMTFGYIEDGQMYVERKAYTDEQGNPVSELVSHFSFYWKKQ